MQEKKRKRALMEQKEDPQRVLSPTREETERPATCLFRLNNTTRAQVDSNTFILQTHRLNLRSAVQSDQ